MAVIGTPIQTCCDATDAVQEGVSQVPCDEQNQVAPDVSHYYRELVLSRMRSVKGNCGQELVIEWQMLDHMGHIVNLEECCGLSSGSSFSSESEPSSLSMSSDSVSESSESSEAEEEEIPCICFRIRENLSLGINPEPAQTEYEATVVDAATGQIKIVLPPNATGVPGVYFAEAAAVDRRGVIIFTNVFYVILNRGQFGSHRHMQGGPPTIQEIRLHLRDSSPAESLLLDNIKFDDAEIALAISRPIDYWNEIPPPLDPRMTTQNFPYRYHWLEAIAANLFWMVEENFRANNLTYSAAGVQVNDQDKEPNYARAAERRWANWVNFVKRQKSSMNLDLCWGGIGSSYAFARGTYYGRGY